MACWPKGSPCQSQLPPGWGGAEAGPTSEPQGPFSCRKVLISALGLPQGTSDSSPHGQTSCTDVQTRGGSSLPGHGAFRTVSRTSAVLCPVPQPVCPQAEEDRRETPNAARRGGSRAETGHSSHESTPQREGTATCPGEQARTAQTPQGGWMGHTCTRQTETKPQVCILHKPL